MEESFFWVFWKEFFQGGFFLLACQRFFGESVDFVYRKYSK